MKVSKDIASSEKNYFRRRLCLARKADFLGGNPVDQLPGKRQNFYMLHQRPFYQKEERKTL